MRFRSLDGLWLEGSMADVEPRRQVAVFVHGAGGSREEGGFFSRLAEGLAAAGVASLRFDLRGHGRSEGRQEDLTISAIANDIEAAVEQVGEPVNLVGVSFGGGISAYFAARQPDRVRALVLLCPVLDYRQRYVDDKSYWKDGHIDEEAGRRLSAEGSLPHSSTFRLGRPLLNEVFHVQPHLALPQVRARTLIVHGTRDSVIPIASSRHHTPRFGAGAELVEIEGADHCFAAPNDLAFIHPQTLVWQAHVIRLIRDWIAGRPGYSQT